MSLSGSFQIILLIFSPVVLQWMWFAIGSALIVSFWVYLKAKKSVPMRLCFSFHWVHFKHDRCIFEICHMVDSLITLLGFILVYTGSFQSYMNFWWCLHFWDHIGLCFWFIGCYLPNFHFSWCNCWIFAWLKLLIGVLLSALVGFSPGMPTR